MPSLQGANLTSLKKCEKCKTELRKKEKDWQEIAAGSSADGNYIKEKLFKRVNK